MNRSSKKQKRIEKTFGNYKKKTNKTYNICLYLNRLGLVDNSYVTELDNLNNLSLEEFAQNKSVIFDRTNHIQTEIKKILFEHLKSKLLEKLKKIYSENLVLNLQDWELMENFKIIREEISRNKYTDEDFNKYLPVYCPVCMDFNFSIYSDYLYDVFKDDYFAYMAAVLVTHYRHGHISYYDRSWKYPWYREKNKEYKSYEEFKILVNNRAKRQILRKIKKDKNIKQDAKISLVKAFKKLQFNDEKTDELVEKILKELTNDKKDKND